MIKKLFNVDNPFWQGMTTIFDLFVLNSLWLVCCLPIFTIGPATAAVYYALICRLRGEDSYLRTDFFHSFRQNFRQGVKVGLPLTLIGLFLAADVVLCRHAGHGIYTFFMVFFAVFFILWAFVALYTFPLLSKFEYGSKELLIKAFYLSFKNITLTLAMLFVIVCGLWLCHILPGLIFIVFGMIFQFCATIFLSIFKPELPPVFHGEDEAALDDSTNGGGLRADYSDFDEAAFYGYSADDSSDTDSGDTFGGKG